MEYRKLGKTGIKVSALSFGSWLAAGDGVDLNTTRELCAKAYASGINTFDTAEVYSAGAAELFMGEALRNFPRESLVVITKIFWGGSGPNDTGHSFKRLVEGSKNSLRRLGMDYVDLLLCHRKDDDTSVEETVYAMDTLIRQGHFLYWGTSEWNPKDIEAAAKFAESHGLHGPVVEQPEYNLFHRENLEKNFRSTLEKYGIGTTVWSPLASGVLTGKYQNGIPKGSRLDFASEFTPEDFEDRKAKTSKFLELAQSLGKNPASLAIAWCLKNPLVSTVLIGATKMEQLEQNLGALETYHSLSEKDFSEIEKIFN